MYNIYIFIYIHINKCISIYLNIAILFSMRMHLHERTYISAYMQEYVYYAQALQVRAILAAATYFVVCW